MVDIVPADSSLVGVYYIPLASPYSLMPGPSTIAKIDPAHLTTRLGENTPYLLR